VIWLRSHPIMRLAWLFRLACLLLIFAPLASSQIGTAMLEGIVEDSSGSRIPDARVRLVSGITGAESHSVTGHEGSFALPGVFPGPYSLTIERDGFSTAQISGIALSIGESKSLLIRLTVGPVNETIRIDAADVAVDTTEGASSTQISGKLAARLPLNGRSFEDLFTLTPGALMDSPQAIEGRNPARGGVGINGQRSDMNRFFVDGISANFGLPDLTYARKFPASGNSLALTAMGTTLSLASVDALQEFRAVGSTSLAEYGGALGGQFSLNTRSGSEQVHGALFEYFRNSVADGLDWFSGFNGLNEGSNGSFNHGDISFLPYHQNDFGGTFASPLPVPDVDSLRRKMFLFFSGERTHVFQPTAFRLQFLPNIQVPVGLQPVLRDYPTFGLPDPAEPALIPLLTSDSLPGNESIASFRLDGNITSNTSGFIRISTSASNGQTRNLSSLTTSNLQYRALTLGTNQQISATVFNDVHFGSAEASSHLQTLLGGYPNLPFHATNLATDFGAPSAIGPVRAESYIRIGRIGESAIDVDDATAHLRQWNLRDTLTFQVGHQLFRVGMEYRRLLSAVKPAPFSIQADFFTADSLSNNQATAIAITRNEKAEPVLNELSAFVQDDWKLTRSLTVSPGLRWELNPPPHGADGADAYTLLGTIASPATLRLAPRGTPLWQTTWFNVAPRIGAAWTANKQDDSELVVRAGAGVYFGTDNEAAAEAFNALGFSATNLVVNTPIPVPSSQFDFSTSPSAPYTKSEAIAFPRHFQLPYSIQWNLGLEQSLGRGQTLGASWVGASGRRLTQERRTDVSATNPNFGEVTWFPGALSSNYQSLQLKFQRSISPGLQALAYYDWSHNIDFGSTDPLFPLTRGNADIDVRQSFQAALSWNQRTHAGGWFKENMLSGWGLDGRLTARTAFPVNLLGNVSVDPATGDRYFSGVDLVQGRPLYLSDRRYPGGRIFNGGPNASNPAFVLPETSQPGNASRNIVRGFGDFQLNAALRRELHIHKSWTLQFRAEAFNITNHPDLGYIDPRITDELFGQAQLQLNQSFGSPGSLYQPGGPRSLQLSLRLHF
jgi:hypothetical protein